MRNTLNYHRDVALWACGIQPMRNPLNYHRDVALWALWPNSKFAKVVFINSCPKITHLLRLDFIKTYTIMYQTQSSRYLFIGFYTPANEARGRGYTVLHSFVRAFVRTCVRSTAEKTAGTISLKFDVRIPMDNTLGRFLFAIRPIFWPPGGHLENQTLRLCVRSTTQKTDGTISLKFDVRIPMGNTLGTFFHFHDLTYYLASRRPSWKSELPF
jgi:hypothetical protein